MRRTGSATLPLHSGRAPRWLFERMSRMSRGVLIALCEDSGPQGALHRLSDPYWFQALGCLMGFDWHSSGLTTTVCGALKEAATGAEEDLGIAVAGGKGRASLRTPDDLRRLGDRFGFDADELVYASRMVAKVDNNALQDGYRLYHHTFFVTPSGEWAVVQQGMRQEDATARRYHWLGAEVDDFVCEPHKAICSMEAASDPTSGCLFEDGNSRRVLNLVAAEASGAREAIAEISRRRPAELLGELGSHLQAPKRHGVISLDVDPRRLNTTFAKTFEAQAENFEQLLGLAGVGAKTLRALALLSELLAGAPPSWRDPARYAFAHGGKDGHPYPVDVRTYDSTLEILERAIRAAKLGRKERLDALRRLHLLTY